MIFLKNDTFSLTKRLKTKKGGTRISVCTRVKMATDFGMRIVPDGNTNNGGTTRTLPYAVTKNAIKYDILSRKNFSTDFATLINIPMAKIQGRMTQLI